jgi:TonB family protein
MKPLKSADSFAVLILGIIFTIAGSHSTNAFAQIPQEAFKNIPSDCQSIFVIDVQRFTKSPLYARLIREKKPMDSMIDALTSFAFSTGADLVHDVDYLALVSTGQSSGSGFILLSTGANFGGGAISFPQGSTARAPVMIATGRFDYEKIDKYLRCSMYPQKVNFKGVAMLVFPKQAGDMGVAFLNHQEIAVGARSSLEMVIKTKAGMKKNILSDPQMASLIGNPPSAEMFWFAGKSLSSLRMFSLSYPISSDLKGVIGAASVTNSLVGKIEITAKNESGSKKIANTFGIPGQYAEIWRDGLKIYQSGSQIDLWLELTATKMERLWNESNPSGSGNAVNPPVPFLKPMPPYTEEARKAKIEGNMQIQATVLKDGTPTNIKIVNGLGYGLDESAINTIAEMWRFIPALINSSPIEAKASFDIPFSLADNRWK